MLLFRVKEESRSSWCHLVDHPQRVEAAGVADERQELGDHVEQQGAVVADVQVRRDVALACGSQPPSETSMAKVSSSRVGMSIPVRVKWSPKQFADRQPLDVLLVAGAVA